MSISDLGSIGEFVGAIGVIASLIYLAVQIRRSDQSTRAATVQSLLGRSTEIVLQQAFSGFDSSNASENQLDVLLFGLFSHFNNAYYQKSVGMLDDETWSMFNERMKVVISRHDNFDVWWERSKRNFTRSFVDYVNTTKGA